MRDTDFNDGTFFLEKRTIDGNYEQVHRVEVDIKDSKILTQYLKEDYKIVSHRPVQKLYFSGLPDNW